MEKKAKELYSNKNVKKLVLTVGMIFPLMAMIVLLNLFVEIRAIPTTSMENTILAGDVALINKLSYQRKNPQRGDVVLLQKDGEDVIKRIIGVSGDKINFSNGKVYVNGIKIKEVYLEDGRKTECEKTFLVPKGKYFLLGDNRENSEDSRKWKEPYVDRNSIKGRTYFSFGFKNGIHIRAF